MLIATAGSRDSLRMKDIMRPNVTVMLKETLAHKIVHTNSDTCCLYHLYNTRLCSLPGATAGFGFGLFNSEKASQTSSATLVLKKRRLFLRKFCRKQRTVWTWETKEREVGISSFKSRSRIQLVQPEMKHLSHFKRRVRWTWKCGYFQYASQTCLQHKKYISLYIP